MLIPETVAHSSVSRTPFGRFKPIPIIVVIYWLAMLVTSTDLLDASLLAAAIAFGLVSVQAAGGLKTIPGLLNFILILKFLLIAILLKTVTFQAADSNLQAPRTTAEVMAVGFFALYAGSVIFRYVTKINGLVGDVQDSKTYLWLTIVFSIVCLGSTFLILVFQTSYETVLAGGVWGFAHQFEVTAPFCIVTALYYAWSSGSRRFLSHPLVLGLLIVQIGLGIAGTTKQAMLEPVLCYLTVGFIRYGLFSKAVWGIVGVGIFLYVSILYPYSQFVRNHGGRDGSLSERLDVIREVFFSIATDADFRQSVDSQLFSDTSYLGKNSLQSVGRMAMIGEADRLIAATDATQSYTGWQTITPGVSMMIPSFIMPDKPVFALGNLLGHITGELGADDMNTQVSFGFMANLYNAFGLAGVFWGTVIFITIFFYVIRLWFSAPTLSFGPFGSSVWYVMLGVAFQHSIVEAPLAYDFPILVNVAAVVGLIYVAKFLGRVFSSPRIYASY